MKAGEGRQKVAQMSHLFGFHPVKKILFPNSSDLKIHLKMKNPAYEYLQAEKM